MPELKFCGLTRPEDAAVAGELDAAYVGVILAGGPRDATPARARLVLAAAGHASRRVGVFGTQTPGEVREAAEEIALDIVQLHADPSPADVEALRRIWRGEIWAAVRCAGLELPAHAASLFRCADAVVLDAKVSGQLGGTGVPLAWSALRDAVGERRGTCRLILAGGLRPENVETAVRALAPEVVDVSSGVEETPGIKDHARMRAFAAAARS